MVLNWQQYYCGGSSDGTTGGSDDESDSTELVMVALSLINLTALCLWLSFNNLSKYFWYLSNI
jgi:hypothetical protein